MRNNVQSQLICNFVYKCRIFLIIMNKNVTVQINSKCIMFETYVKIILNPHLTDLC